MENREFPRLKRGIFGLARCAQEPRPGGGPEPCSSIFFLKKLYVRPLSLQRLRLGCSLSVYDPARADRQPAGAFKSSSTRRNGTSTVLNTRVTLYMHGAFHWAPHRCYMPHRHVCPKNPKKGAELFVTPPRSQALHNTLFGSVTTPFLPRTTSHSTQSRWEAAGSPPVAPGKLQEVVHPTRKAAGSSPPHPGGRGKSPAAPGKLRATRLTREAVGSQEWLSAVSGASPYRPKTAFRREVVRKVDLGTSINTTRRALHMLYIALCSADNIPSPYSEIGYIFVSASPFFSLKI